MSRSISKALRFEIFKRDGFTCRYCGKQPPSVKLVIDHVDPVSKGGTSMPSNLITSCETCNQGKGAKSMKDVSLTDEDSLRRSQENLEQISQARLAHSAVMARRKMRQEIEEYFKDIYNGTHAGDRGVSALLNLADEFGVKVLLRWIDSAHSRDVRCYDAIQYICGIARNVRKGRE